MKKKLIAFSILICVLIMFIPSESYGTCNTVRFTKKLTAIKLILSDGRVLNDLKLQQDMAASGKKEYKTLYLAFVVNNNCSFSEHEEIKSFIKNTVDKVYELYEEVYADKAEEFIKISVRLYDGTEPDVFEHRSNIIGSETDKNTIKSIVDNIARGENNVHISSAVGDSIGFFPYNESNDNVMKMLVLFTSGNLDVTKDGESKLEVNLNDLMDNGMVSIFNINEESSSNKFSLRDFSEIGFTYAEGTPGYASSTIPGVIKDIIAQDALKSIDLDPETMKYEGVQILPNVVQIIVDNEILHGATLKAEYELLLTSAAAYGNGDVRAFEITDMPDLKYTFSKKEHLLTAPEKTNEDYGWKREGDNIVNNNTSFARKPVKLVLTCVITPNMKDLVFENEAKGFMEYNVDKNQGTYRSVIVFAKAAKIRIIPPTGTSNTPYICSSIITVFIITICVVAKNKKRKNNL